jgi:hypothetical protein
MKDIPNVKKWLPSQGQSGIAMSFLNQCRISEEIIHNHLRHEQTKNIHPFDSGPTLEEIIIEQFKLLFSKRYSIKSGIICDSKGMTSGHNDIFFFNDTWFPLAVSGVTKNEKKQVFPIDGIYSVGEVKTTLSIDSLDQAFEKLVKSSRLTRIKTKDRRLVENRESTSCIHGLSNPLYTFIIAEGIDKGVDFQDLIYRFIAINKCLKRSEVVRAMCVLGHGTVVWSFRESETSFRPALFMREDLYEPIYLTLLESQPENPALFSLIQNLQLHLFHSVLAAEDFALYYGNVPTHKVALEDHLTLMPDKEQLELLEKICDCDH